jgi:hypothetical protein
MLLAALLPTALGQAGTARAEETCPGEAQGFRSLDQFAAYRFEPAELKVGQFFAVEVVTCRATPADRVIVYARMPAHGHGMNYQPTREHIAPGRYRFTGLMLHMAGIWRFTFIFEFRKDSSSINSSSITYRFDVDLKR